jgi:hypothetical protein
MVQTVLEDVFHTTGGVAVPQVKGHCSRRQYSSIVNFLQQLVMSDFWNLSSSNSSEKHKLFLLCNKIDKEINRPIFQNTVSCLEQYDDGQS